MSDKCPDCGKLYALVNRVHRCVPRAEAVASVTKRVTTVVTPPSQMVTPMVTAVVTRPKPKRDRAAYMRDYRKREREATAVNGALGFGC